MIKSYNSYVKHIFKLAMFVIIPVVLFLGMLIIHKTGLLGTLFEGDTDFIFAPLSIAVFSVFTAMVWSIFDFYSFTGTLSKKSQGIEFLKTSKRAKKYFMDVVIFDIIIKLVAYVVLVGIALLEIKALTGFAVLDVLEMNYPYIIIGISMCFCMCYINRHFSNAQTFMITTYLVFSFNGTVLGVVQAIISEAKASDTIMKNADKGLAALYGLAGVICLILTICKTKKCINESWYSD